MLRPIPFPLPYAPFGTARRLARRLREALERGELELHYQPKVQIDTGRATSVEALLRWRDPDAGLVSPDAFLPGVEQHRVMEEIGFHVLDCALRQATAWRRAGVPLGVSVNVSPGSLLDAELPATVGRALERCDVPPDGLVLEITETAVLQDLERCAAILRQIAGRGIGISLDDFGTGHSSLTRLLQLPIDELKIDRVFVRDMVRDSAGSAVVCAVVGLAQDLGHRVVAEGVEDAETLDRLAELGCDEAQGYHICRPLPPPELPDWVLESARARSTAIAC